MAFETIDDFTDAVVTVMGLGRFTQGSGVGATKWLLRHGAQVIITDLKSEEDLKESVDEVTKWYERYRKELPGREIYHPIFVLGEHREEDFTDVQAVLQNPDVKKESKFVALAREHGVPIFSDLSLFMKFCPYPMTAVTGTRGKTTTTALIGEMQKTMDPKSVTAGNILVSPLEFLDELLAEGKPHPIVLELSSTLLDSIADSKRGPDIGVMTNLYPDHLNRYATFDVYKASKEIIFTLQSPEQAMIMNADNEDVKAMAPKVKSRLFWVSVKELADGQHGCYVKDGTILCRWEGTEETILPVAEVKLEGEHNLSNVVAAVAAARLAKIPVENIQQVLRTFVGVPYRQELVREANGVRYVNDTTATSPDGAIAALKRFGQKGNVVLLAGGASKNTAMDGFAKEIHPTCKYVVLFDGTATDELERLIGEAVPHVRVKSMKEAIHAASSIAKEGDVVLLSPGCASFGIFKNEFDRGDKFNEEVKKIT